MTVDQLLDAATSAHILRDELRNCIEGATIAEEVLLLEWIGTAAKIGETLGRMAAEKERQP